MDARFDEGSISNFDTDRVSHDLRSRKMLSNDEVDKWWVHNKTEFVEFCIILSGWESISRYVLFFKQWKEFSFTFTHFFYTGCVRRLTVVRFIKMTRWRYWRFVSLLFFSRFFYRLRTKDERDSWVDATIYVCM